MDFEWQELTPQAQLVSLGDAVVAVLFEQKVIYGAGKVAWEMCWIPANQSRSRDVLFGVGEDAVDAMATRWERGRRAVELELSRG